MLHSLTHLNRTIVQALSMVAQPDLVLGYAVAVQTMRQQLQTQPVSAQAGSIASDLHHATDNQALISTPIVPS